MAQVLRSESIGEVSRVSNTVLSIAPSVANIGGQQRSIASVVSVSTATTGLNGIDTGSVAPNQFYYVYLVLSNGVVGGVISLSATAPTGFPAYRQVGQCTTDGSSQLVAASKVVVDTAPIGHIISAMLTESQFRAVHGPGWILADGRSVAGSKYATITGTSTAPDLRGQFLRGKNNGRSDGNQDTGGERALGAQQAQTTAVNGLSMAGAGAHQHNGRGNTFDGAYPLAAGQFGLATDSGLGINANNSGGGGGRVRPTTLAYDGVGDHSHGISGDSETRPRNVAVNHFIKIN